VDCPTCNTETERTWTVSGGKNEDATWAGGRTFENMNTHNPVTFYSPAEHKAFMKKQGIEPAVRHVGVQGSDRSPHTVRWTCAPVQTEAERLRDWWAHEATLTNPITKEEE
jgi:hypothetical protein